MQVDVTDTVIAQQQLQAAHAELAKEKAHMHELLVRQFNLIECLGKVTSVRESVGNNTAAAALLQNVLNQMVTSSSQVALDASQEDIKLLEPIGQGSVGFRAP